MATDRLVSYDIFCYFYGSAKKRSRFPGGTKGFDCREAVRSVRMRERYESFRAEPMTEWTRTEYDDFPTCIDSRPGGAAADRGQARRLAAATFADPGAEYRPVPFWHLNGRLSSDEIVRQLEDAKNLAGFGGVTVLPFRPEHSIRPASPARAWSRLI